MKNTVFEFIPLLGNAFLTALFFVAFYLGVKYLIGRKNDVNKESSIYRQLLLVFIALIGFIAFLLALPIDPSTKSNITSLLGYVISAIVALSSATFFGNMLAGILLRIINNFKPGDFITVNNYKGKISERGLFHTEMQTTDSDLITLPNLFLAVNPVKVTRSSGTFISTEVSLGYDVNRNLVEKCLIEAANNAELEDAFVLITSLGDYSVVYKIHGLQKKVKKLLSSNSRLNASVLDALHDYNIEIVSPTFTNQRQVGETIFIPKKSRSHEKDLQQTSSPEDLIFDKADEAESIEAKKKRLMEVEQKINLINEEIKSMESDEDINKANKKLERYLLLQEKLTTTIASMADEFANK